MLKACKPGKLPVPFVARQLHFKDDEDDDDDDDDLNEDDKDSEDKEEEFGGEKEKGSKAKSAAGSGAAKCVAYLRAAGVTLVAPAPSTASVVAAGDGSVADGDYGSSGGGGGEEEEDPLLLEVDTKASSAKPLELEALLAWEGMTGTLL
jgi:hypothetical protein